MPKKAIRRDFLARRRNLDAAVWQAASIEAQVRLIRLVEFQEAACIALYSPVQCEIDTTLLFLEARAHGKSVLYPAVHGDVLQFIEVVEPEELVNGCFGIPEPLHSDRRCAVASADLIVVPGVAFDLRGYRVGFGKGYYDRCLSQLPNHGILIGLCHDFQIVEHIPVEDHDIKMQYIVTDKRMIIPTGEKSRNRPGAGLT